MFCVRSSVVLPSLTVVALALPSVKTIVCALLAILIVSVWLALIVLLRRCELSTVTAFQAWPEVLIVSAVSLLKASPVNVTALLVRFVAVSLILLDVFFELDEDFFLLELEDFLLDSPETLTELLSILVDESLWLRTIAVSQIAAKTTITTIIAISVGRYFLASLTLVSLRFEVARVSTA